MPTINAIIEYGELSDIRMVDEPDILVQSLTITPSREKQSWKGANKAIRALQYTNPMLSFAFNGILSATTGLANKHPGSVVTELMNYTGNVYQFDPDFGLLVFEDPSRSLTLENPAETDFTVVQYPFIGHQGDTWIPDAET